MVEMTMCKNPRVMEAMVTLHGEGFPSDFDAQNQVVNVDCQNIRMSEVGKENFGCGRKKQQRKYFLPRNMLTLCYEVYV